VIVAERLRPTRGSARLDALPPRPTAGQALTSRQREVLLLVAQGLSREEAARVLGVSETTVRTQMARILVKLGARNRTEAVHRAWLTGAFVWTPGGVVA
jgi:DNA-binding NarL/FixJ family response regulator